MSEMTKSFLRHDTKQSRKAAVEEVKRCGCYVLW